MSAQEKKAIHVNPIGENWEVESDSATLGQAETKSEAIELARQIAAAEPVSRIEVHSSDGQVEQRLLGVEQSTQDPAMLAKRLNADEDEPVEQPGAKVPAPGAAPLPD
jgi:hypothetical protein